MIPSIHFCFFSYIPVLFSFYSLKRLLHRSFSSTESFLRKVLTKILSVASSTGDNCSLKLTAGRFTGDDSFFNISTGHSSGEFLSAKLPLHFLPVITMNRSFRWNVPRKHSSFPCYRWSRHR